MTIPYASYKREISKFCRTAILNAGLTANQHQNTDFDSRKSLASDAITIVQYVRNVDQQDIVGYSRGRAICYLECYAPSGSLQLIKQLQESIVPQLMLSLQRKDVLTNGSVKALTATERTVGYNADSAHYRVDILLNFTYEGLAQ